jgi:hypothetical protein
MSDEPLELKCGSLEPSDYVVQGGLPTFDTTPVHTFTMQNADGKQAHVDFGGDAVTYSGDLPFDESAKLLFDALFQQFKPRCKTCDWYNIANRTHHHQCSCPKMVYGYYRDKQVDQDGITVEDDEGWGMMPEPDFGCIHHKEKSCLMMTNQKT